MPQERKGIAKYAVTKALKWLNDKRNYYGLKRTDH